MDVLKQFGLFIREQRKELGMSQEKLAELCDLSLRRIVSIEQGQSNVRFINLVRLCTVLKIDIGELDMFYTSPYEED